MTSPESWMENARLRLEAARLLFNEELYGECLSRAYFAMFAAARALLAEQGAHAKGHKGVHHLLFKFFSTDVETSTYHTAWTDREDYDYRLKVPDRAYAAQRLQEAERFLETVTRHLKQ